MFSDYVIVFSIMGRGRLGGHVCFLESENLWVLQSWQAGNVFHFYNDTNNIKCMHEWEFGFRTMDWSEVPDYLRAQVMMLVNPD